MSNDNEPWRVGDPPAGQSPVETCRPLYGISPGTLALPLLSLWNDPKAFHDGLQQIMAIIEAEEQDAGLTSSRDEHK